MPDNRNCRLAMAAALGKALGENNPKEGLCVRVIHALTDLGFVVLPRSSAGAIWGNYPEGPFTDHDLAVQKKERLARHDPNSSPSLGNLVEFKPNASP